MKKRVNGSGPAAGHTTAQNLRFGFLLVCIALFVAGWWLFSIRNGYYAAFVEYVPDNVALSVDNANNRVRTAADNEMIAPFQSAFDSWRNRHLAEDVYTEGAEGAILHGRLYDCGSDKTVIFLPGFGEDASGDFLYAPFYEELGWNILMTDPRCAGQSEGAYLSYGLLEQEDAAAWCRAVTERGIGRALVLHGYGMGSAAALTAAGEQLLSDNVVLIVAESVYDSLEDLAHYEMKAWFGLPSFPFLNAIEGKMAKLVGYTPNDVTVSRNVSDVSVPVVFIAGESDDYIPCEYSESVYHVCGGRKEWLSVPDAERGMCYPLAAERIQSAIRGYISII